MTRLKRIFLGLVTTFPLVNLPVAASANSDPVDTSTPPSTVNTERVDDSNELTPPLFFDSTDLISHLSNSPSAFSSSEQGLPRYLSLNSLPVHYTRAVMNGFNIPGTDDGRTVRFDLIPTLMLNNAAWERTTDAALRTDVSGYVNLTTFDPFSQPGLSLTAAGGAGQQNIGNDLTHELGARVSWSGEHIGFYVFQSQNRIDLIRDYRTYNLGNNDDGELLVHELGFGNNLINNRSDSDGFHLEYRIGIKQHTIGYTELRD